MIAGCVWQTRIAHGRIIGSCHGHLSFGRLSSVTVRSVPGPPWCPLLAESRGTLARVRGRADRLGYLALTLELLGGRPVPRFREDAFGRGHRQRAVRGDRGGELQRGIDSGSRRNHAVDQ